MMKSHTDHLFDRAQPCQFDTDRLLGRNVVEAELLQEAAVSFKNAMAGLPIEDLDEIPEFIGCVRER